MKMTLTLEHSQHERLAITALRTEIAVNMAKIRRTVKRWKNFPEQNIIVNDFSSKARGIVDAAIRMHNMGCFTLDTLNGKIINYHHRLVTRTTVWQNTEAKEAR